MAIMDLPRHFIMREPALFTRFDDIVIVGELTLQSLRDVNRLLKLMAVRNRQAKVHVIANQVGGQARRDGEGVRGGDGGAAALRLPARPEGHGADDAQGPAAGARPTPKHKIVADLHRLCIELAGVPGGGEGRRRLLPAPGEEEVARWKTDSRAG